jgi:hypothetical protein
MALWLGAPEGEVTEREHQLKAFWNGMDPCSAKVERARYGLVGCMHVKSTSVG